MEQISRVLEQLVLELLLVKHILQFILLVKVLEKLDDAVVESFQELILQDHFLNGCQLHVVGRFGVILAFLGDQYVHRLRGQVLVHLVDFELLEELFLHEREIQRQLFNNVLRVLEDLMDQVFVHFLHHGLVYLLSDQRLY